MYTETPDTPLTLLPGEEVPPRIAALDGMFDFPEVYALAVREAPIRATLVEVGNYAGKSLAYLAHLAKQSGKSLRVVGVDWGRGMSGNPNEHPTTSTCLKNLYNLGLHDDVTLVTARSFKAADLFPDASCHFVFIDDDHSEEGARLSIDAWCPKVAPRGLLAGHDYWLPGVHWHVKRRFPGHERLAHAWWVRV